MLFHAVSCFAASMGNLTCRRDGRAIVAMVIVATAFLAVCVAIGIQCVADEDLSISAKMFERIDTTNITGMLVRRRFDQKSWGEITLQVTIDQYAHQ